MIAHFLTKSDAEQFNAWLTQHGNGFYLNRQRRGEWMLHRVDCWHLGDGKWCESTNNAKAASDDKAELIAWSEDFGLSVGYCSSCKPE